MTPQDQVKNYLITHGMAYSSELADLNADYRKILCRLRDQFEKEGRTLISKRAPGKKRKVHILYRAGEQPRLI